MPVDGRGRVPPVPPMATLLTVTCRYAVTDSSLTLLYMYIAILLLCYYT